MEKGVYFVFCLAELNNYKNPIKSIFCFWFSIALVTKLVDTLATDNKLAWYNMQVQAL